MDPVASAIVGKVSEQMTESLFKFMGRQIGYMVHCDQNIRALQDGVENLRAEMETIEGRVDRARDNAEEIEPNVSKWLSDVGALLKGVEQFLADKGSLKCCNGWCPHIGSRLHLGKEAEKKMMDVVKYKGGGKFFSVAHRPLLTDVGFIPSTTYCEHFGSRALVFNQIIEALKDDNVYMFGIYGMAGVGKTTWVNQIARQAKDSKLFDEVAKTVISQKKSKESLQIA